MVRTTVDAEPMQVFGAIRSLDVRSLAGPVLSVNVPAGVRLMNEGQAIGTFFVIRSGSAEIWHGDRRLRTLGTGDCFGEIDPGSSEPQLVSVIAVSPMRLIAFSAFGIDRLCAAIPDARERILASLPEELVEVDAPALPVCVLAG
jgi:CRP-like cAMP-binding protein